MFSRIVEKVLFRLNIRRLNNSQRNVRIKAIEWFVQKRDKRAIEPLLTRLALQETDDYASRNLKEALTKLGVTKQQVMQKYLLALQSPSSFFRFKAIDYVRINGDYTSTSYLLKMLSDSTSQGYDGNTPIGWFVAKALCEINDPSAVQPLINALSSNDWCTRMCAAVALAGIGDRRAVTPLSNLVSDKDSRVRFEVECALNALKRRGYSF